MAHPRRIVPGETYLITRRCTQRAFRLKPTAVTTHIFKYCIAFAMKRTGVRVHAVCVMSNHHHLVVTDPNGTLPDFLRELHRLTAKAMNASQGQWENLWAAEPCNVVRLVTDDDVEDKIAYVVANPVAAGLVEQPDQWPGFLAWGEKSFHVTRPAAYFREDGECPAELQLVIDAPPTRDREALTLTDWTERIARAIAATVAAAHRSIKAAGKSFLGRAAILAASFIRRAQASEDKRGVVPTFAARVESVRDQLRRTEQQFRAQYREALALWRSGERGTLFPFGTWGMVVFHAVEVEEASAA